MRTHTGEKPYSCVYCLKSFTAKPDLHVHKRIHIELFPHTCDYCMQPFNKQPAKFKHEQKKDETTVTILSVTPGFLLPPQFWIWTAFTFCFIELHFWEVLVDIITVGLCGKLLEQIWGQMEMFTFFAITNLGVALLTSFYYLFVYMCTKNSEILFDVHIHGLAGYVAGISVAVRQMMPDHLIAKSRMGKFTNRNVPLTVLFVSLILWTIGLLDGTYPAMFCTGLIVSWVYLRFYQRHPNGRGDSSQSFTFASFFPNVMQPTISILVNPLYLCCLKIGIVTPPALPRTSSSTSLSSVSISMPGVDPHDIERRRQIALKALSERLKTTADSSKQSTLPKSFPGKQHQHNHGHGAGHSHVHHQHHSGHSHEHHQHHDAGHSHFDASRGDGSHFQPTQTIPTKPMMPFGVNSSNFDPNKALANYYFPPAIPLPPPPTKSSVSTANNEETLISIDTDSPASLVQNK